MPDLFTPPPDPRELPEHVTTPLLTLITHPLHGRGLRPRRAAACRARGRATRAGRAWTTVAVGWAPSVCWSPCAAVQTSRDADVQELGRGHAGGRRSTPGGPRSPPSGARSGALDEARNAAGPQRHPRGADGRPGDPGHAASRWAPARRSVARACGSRSPTRSASDPNDEVRDEDLATLVDGLWQAGAEAIAINGIRLTALSGIRNTGRGHPGQQPAAHPAVRRGGHRRQRHDAVPPARDSRGQAWFSSSTGSGSATRPRT